MAKHGMYSLSLNGELFRRQRELLIRLDNGLSEGETVHLDCEDQLLLHGLIDLTDAIADQAELHYNIPCSLTEGDDDQSDGDEEESG